MPARRRARGCSTPRRRPPTAAAPASARSPRSSSRSTSTATPSCCSTASCAAMLPDGEQRQVAGFRYFNVYGPREQHKGRMASVAFHHFNQFRDDRQGAPVRRLRRLRPRAAGARLRLRRRRGRRQPVVPAAPANAAASSTSAAAARSRSTTWRWRWSTRCARAARRGAADARRDGRAGPDRVHRLPRRPGRQVPVLHRRPTWPRLRATGCDHAFADVATGVRRYVEWLARLSARRQRAELSCR